MKSPNKIMRIFFATQTKKDTLKKLVCMICNTDLLSESVCGNLQPRFSQTQWDPTGNDSGYCRAASLEKEKNWGEKLKSSSAQCGWGSGGSLLFKVLVKYFLDLEHGMRGFFYPSRAERPCFWGREGRKVVRWIWFQGVWRCLKLQQSGCD